MSKNKHPAEIPHYEGRMNELVEFIVGSLRYDRAMELHRMLAERYRQEARQERLRGRRRLALRLEQAAAAEECAAEKMSAVWKICAPYTL